MVTPQKFPAVGAKEPLTVDGGLLICIHAGHNIVNSTNFTPVVASLAVPGNRTPVFNFKNRERNPS